MRINVWFCSTALVLIFGLLGCESAKPPMTSEQQAAVTPSAPQAPRPAETAVDGSERKREAFARSLTSVLRHEGIDASANMVNSELVVSGSDLGNHNQREIFAGSVFTKKAQQKLCDIGVHKILLSGSLVGSQDEYDLTCKATATESKFRQAQSVALRQSYVRQLSIDMQKSNITNVSTVGTEIDFTAKPGTKFEEVRSGLSAMAQSAIQQHWCGMGFTKIRVKRNAADEGVSTRLHCTN